MNGIPWDHDIQRLLELNTEYAGNLQKIAPHFPERSVDGIRHKLRDLGLRGPPPRRRAVDESPAVQEWVARREAATREAQVYLPRRGELNKLRKQHPDLDTVTALDVLEDIRAEARSRPAPEKPKVRWVPESDRHALELDVFDLHLGKLAHHEETGENYDTKIASERAEAAVEDLLAQASHYAIEQVILPWGSDFLHYDTLAGTTTAGTLQDRDSRYTMMYRRAFHLSVRIVERCASIAPVSLIIIPGNHDEISAFTLGVALEARFHADPRVTVDNSANPRKYIRYGANLIGFAHGHNEPHKRYPMLMPVEAPEDWALTKHREMHVGHFHVSKVTAPVVVGGENGVRVRILRSLSGVDAWHAKMGYVGEPAGAEAYVWGYTRGLRANLITQVERSGV